MCSLFEKVLSETYKKYPQKVCTFRIKVYLCIAAVSDIVSDQEGTPCESATVPAAVTLHYTRENEITARDNLAGRNSTEGREARRPATVPWRL